MSRWADTFARLSGDADTLDTMRHSEAPPSTVSHCVNSVTAAPAATATTAGVPFMITAAMKADLGLRGYTPDQIRNLTPAEAHANLASVSVPDAAVLPPLEGPLATWGEAEEERAAIVEHAPDPEWWRDEYAERAAIRQFEGGYPRVEAELLAWRELENRWNLAHGERAPRELCAGCRRPIGTEAALDLIDGNRVHDRDGNDCLIRHGERWRAAATRALVGMGLQPPVGDGASSITQVGS